MPSVPVTEASLSHIYALFTYLYVKSSAGKVEMDTGEITQIQCLVCVVLSCVCFFAALLFKYK